MKQAKRVVENEQNKTKILVVDDHPIVRDGLTELLNHEIAFVVSAKAGNAAEATMAVKKQRIDLALIDMLLENTTGIQITKKIKVLCPNLIVLIFSMSDKLEYVKQAFYAGARGYILKDEISEKIVVAIKHVLQGKVYLSKRLAKKLPKQELSKLIADNIKHS